MKTFHCTGCGRNEQTDTELDAIECFVCLNVMDLVYDDNPNNLRAEVY